MKKYYLFLAVLCLASLYLGSIWLRPPFHPEETCELEVAREMLASGECLVPRLNGFPCYETLILGVWLNACSMKVFGETPGAARLPGALATLAAAGLLYWFCRDSGEERVGRVAAVIFLLSGLVFFGGTEAVFGALFRFFLLLTMTMLYFSCRRKSCWERAPWLVAAGVGMGSAVLAGGAVAAIVLPLAALAGFLIWQNDWKRLFTLPWIPLAFAIPTIVLIGSVIPHRNSGGPMEFLLENFPLGNALFWLALPTAVAGMLPWVLFLPGVLAGYRGRCKEAFRTPLLRCAVCMGCVWLALLSFSVKAWGAAAAMLPCFPAFAILLAWGLVRYAQSGKLYRETDRVLRLILFCGIPALAVFFALQVFNRWLPRRIPAELLPYRSGENFYFPVFAAMVFLIWVGMTLWARGAEAKFVCFCVATGFVAFTYPALPPPHRTAGRMPVDFIAREARRSLTPETLVLADASMVSATAWALRRADIGVCGNPGAFARESECTEWRERFYPPDRIAGIVKEGRRPVLVVSASEEQVREMPATPEKSYRRRGGLFIVHYRKQGEANL